MEEVQQPLTKLNFLYQCLPEDGHIYPALRIIVDEPGGKVILGDQAQRDDTEIHMIMEIPPQEDWDVPHLYLI